MNRYFATVARGLEEIAAKELENLGAKQVNPTFTGVHFQGDKTLLYKTNLWARTIFRVLVPIAEFTCRNSDQLYHQIQKIDWRDYLTPRDTLAVDCTGGNSSLNHSHFSALQVKNAIVDQQRKQTGKRSNVDANSPDIRINIHIHRDRAILSLDSSGESLHRRGYHAAMGLAPLKETLAAALIEMTEWDTLIPFLDPLCGSGTLPIEAGLKALQIAPGLLRESFGFEKWRDFDAQLWQQLCEDAQSQEKTTLPAAIYGSDRDENILAQACTNAAKCDLASHIHFMQTELAQLESPASEGIILCNPPYGKRIGNSEELGALYKLLGDILKQRFKGWTAYVLSGNKELSKQIGLKTSRRIPVYNGFIACTLSKYELY